MLQKIEKSLAENSSDPEIFDFVEESILQVLEFDIFPKFIAKRFDEHQIPNKELSKSTKVKNQ